MWVAYFLNAVAEHARQINRKSKDLFDLYRDSRFLALTAKNSQAIKNFIFQQPIFTIPSLKKYLEKGREGTAHNLRGKLQAALSQKDILVLKEGGGRQPTWYVCPNIIAIMQR